MSFWKPRKDSGEILCRFMHDVSNLDRREAIDDIVAEDCVFHFPVGKVEGREGFKQHIEFSRAAFSEVRVELFETISQGDRAAVRWRYTLHHSNPLGDIPATGRDLILTGVTTGRFRRGRLVEVRDHYDLLGFLAQMGALPEDLEALTRLTEAYQEAS